MSSPFKHSRETPTQEEILAKLTELNQVILSKNEIIEHLNARIKNQEQQIDMLVTDAEEKHMHEIQKHYVRSYEKYLRHGRYLLLDIQGVADETAIYLPRGAKIVHSVEADTVTELQGDVSLGGKKPSMKLETSCKGLSQQMQTLKDKLKAYSQLIDEDTQQQSDPYLNEQRQAQREEDGFSPQAKDSYIHDLEEKLRQQEEKMKQQEKKMKQLETSKVSVAPAQQPNGKKPHTSKSYFVRKY